MNDFIMGREAATGKRPRVYVTEGTTFNVSCFRDQVGGGDDEMIDIGGRDGWVDAAKDKRREADVT